MTVRSVIDIEVNDERFKQVAEALKKFRESAQKVPVDFKKVNAAVGDTSELFETIVHSMYAWSEIQTQLLKMENQQEDKVAKTENHWRNIARWTKTASSNVMDAAKALFRWTAFGTVTTGLLGAGSLYGLDRLAGNVSANRRSSLGLGIGYGQRQSFGVNYGRVVNTDQFLGGVNEALSDVTKRYSLYGAGLSESDLAGKNTGEVSATLINRLKGLADQYPKEVLGQVLQARGLSQFVSLEDMVRLKNTSREELAGYATNYQRDASKLNLTEDTQRKWQDFYVKLDLAGNRLENVFVKGLGKALPFIGKLSDDLADFLEDFTDGPKFKEFMDEAVKGLEGFVDQVSKPEFRQGIGDFISDVGKLGSWVHWLVSMLPGKTVGMTAAGAMAGARVAGAPGALVGGGTGLVLSRIDPNDASLQSTDPDAFWWRSKKPAGPFNRGLVLAPRKTGGGNVGNIRNPAGGFMTYDSQEAGVSAIARLLRFDKNYRGKDTIRQLISTYAPPSENDTHKYIKNMEAFTGFGANEHLNLFDNAVMAKLVAAITRQEGVVKGGVPVTVVLKVINQTGGNPIISMANAAN